ncbi:MAG: hypothetical protein R3B60_00720 [Candidatus Paceibacterota bacterium]
MESFDGKTEAGFEKIEREMRELLTKIRESIATQKTEKTTWWLNKMQEFKHKVYQYEDEEDVWNCLGYHLLWGSTPPYEQITRADFPHPYSIKEFLLDTQAELEETA